MCRGVNAVHSHKAFKCECGATSTKVVDTVGFEGSIKRRRECTGCGQRFNTIETLILTKEKP